MRVDESVLPVIGRKFTITAQSGDCLIGVIHYSGRREVQTYEGTGADEPLYALDLSDQEARRFGALLFRYGPELMRRGRADARPDGVVLDR